MHVKRLANFRWTQDSRLQENKSANSSEAVINTSHKEVESLSETLFGLSQAKGGLALDDLLKVCNTNTRIRYMRVYAILIVAVLQND